MNKQLTLFGEPDSLYQVAPDRLRRLLSHFACDLPSDLVRHTDVKSLIDAFIELGERAPPKLIHALSMISSLSTWDAMDAILTESPNDEWFDDKMTPADVAAESWLRDPGNVERHYARRISRRVRKFEYFQADPDADRALKAFTQQDLRHLEKMLDESFVVRKRDRGTRIVDFVQDDAQWFVIWHGGTLKRDRSWKQGEVDHVEYRPLRFDVVVFHAFHRELCVSVKTQWQKQLYRSAFGTLLFGSAGHFPGIAKYTLLPLEHDLRGALTCIDVDGLEAVTLKELRFQRLNVSNWQTVEMSDDLLQSGCLTFPPCSRMASATFGMLTRKRSSVRMLTILPSNVVKYTPDEDSHWFEE
jgi:hypothetical protein